ncbi:FAD-dependent oxidoreductase [Temperatibacter marinus]|uniref:FAD-dependent oxidoreductase n=1 Tax=Temperatibacter marinus TaxID=1456591 RepID=A0AA52HAY6_9PROT|nr:FAD-dependent oxidoreductase [Temperatibacter marinus]WND03098.1 FAD-dependent oxidoreductase [Temperatibacter marinus]
MKTDFLIIGGGIAGASIGYHLAETHSVIILEMEDQPGYHTTGRSAAFYAESYGGPSIRPLTSASKDFFKSPPKDFSTRPFIAPRGALHLFKAEERDRAEKEAFHAQQLNIPLKVVSKETAQKMHPLLKNATFDGALYDKDCGDLDVAGLHQAYLRGLSQRGGKVMTQCELLHAVREDKVWAAETSIEAIKAGVIVNAAGAWADVIAERCGLSPLQMAPKRRTVITASVQTSEHEDSAPLALAFNETLYFKPESGKYILSPEDETLSDPCDAQPDLEDIALAIYRFEELTVHKLDRPNHTWAGLRTFAPDCAPVIGYDETQSGFFWNVGQGGYGIQTCPAWSTIAASIAKGQDIPESFKNFGCRVDDYTPARLR